MPAPTVTAIAIDTRLAAVRIAEPGARFHLAKARAYRLSGGDEVREGTTDRVVTILSDLQPDTDYALAIDGCRPLAFRTKTCAGVVNAGDFGRPGEIATEALRAAVDAVPAGGTLLIPAGEWLTAPLFLKSDMTLHLAEGARLMAIGDRSRYPILESHMDGRVVGSWEGEPARCYAAILTAVGCRNLRITGTGTVDGGGDRGDWWDWPKTTRDGARRARTIHLIHCENVLLAGVTVCNSPSWTIHPYGCRHIAAVGLSVRNPADSPNTDGFDPESCEDLTIEGVHFSVGDDCVAIKAGKRGSGHNRHLAPTRQVAVRHCLMERGHGGVVLGSEMSGGIENVFVEDCEMRGTDRGLRVKVRRGRGGCVRHVVFRRVAMDRVETAITVNSFYFCDSDGHADWVQSRAPAAVDETTPQVSDFTIEDLELTRLRIAVGVFIGLPESPARRISIANVRASYDDLAEPGIPEMADRLRALRHAGIVAEFAEIALEEGADLTITHGATV